MREAEIGGLMRDAMLVLLKLGAVPLATALTVGLVMSLVQAATQINEQTLAFVPKVLAIGTALLVLGSYMLTTLTDFSRMLFDRLIAVGGQ